MRSGEGARATAHHGGTVKVRRSWAALVPAAALSLALAGCGSSTNGTGGTGATGAAPPPVSQNDINATDVSQVKDGGIFHWELSSMPPQWNPYELDGTLADTADVM